MTDQLPASVQAARAAIKERPPEILILDDDVMTEGELLRAYGVQGPVELVALDPVSAIRRYPENDMPHVGPSGVPDRCRNGHDLTIEADVRLYTSKRKDGTEVPCWSCRVCKRAIRNTTYRKHKVETIKKQRKTGKLVPGSLEADIEVCRLNTLIASTQDRIEMAMPWEKRQLEAALAGMIERKDRLDRSIRVANSKALGK